MNVLKFSLKTFAHNLYNLFAYDLHQYDFRQKKQIDEIRLILALEQMKTFVNDERSQPYKEELEFVLKNGIRNFPYEQQKTLETVESGFDKSKKMPFVLHQGKRLYFPSDFSPKDAEKQYRGFIEKENLLGGGYMKKAPHQYQTENFKVELGDVFVDVGAAEGLVALDVVEKASKLYIIESNRYWIPALKATFEPYKNKCVIVKKMVSDKNSLKSITLSKLLSKEINSPIFIKMDIEGHEANVLESSAGFLSDAPFAKVACCTYHKWGDAEKIVSFFDRLGYKHEFSEGWMLQWIVEDDPLYPPFFRHGVLRARK